jgi:hypothetical protein
MKTTCCMDNETESAQNFHEDSSFQRKVKELLQLPMGINRWFGVFSNMVLGFRKKVVTSVCFLTHNLRTVLTFINHTHVRLSPRAQKFVTGAVVRVITEEKMHWSIFKRAALLVLATAAFPIIGSPCSICKCGDPVFFINGARGLNRGQWVFTIDHFYTSKRSGTIVADAGDLAARLNLAAPLGVQSALHGDAGEESQRQNSVQLVFNYGLSGRIQIMAAVPYSFNRLSSSEESVNSNGFGDPEVTFIARAASLLNSRMVLALSGGVRLPLGSTGKTDGAGEVLDQHAQTGSGAWAGTWGMQVAFGSQALPMFVSTSYQVNGTNDEHFRYGNVWRYNFALQRGLGAGIDLIGEINGRYARQDRELDVRTAAATSCICRRGCGSILLAALLCVCNRRYR